MRAYFSTQLAALDAIDDDQIIGAMASRLPFDLEASQREAWRYEIQHVRQLAGLMPDAHAFFEFVIPRMGRRADVIIAVGGVIFVVEYKVGPGAPGRSGIDQVYGYALDLKHFHETSHGRRIVPILIATGSEASNFDLKWSGDGVAEPVAVAASQLSAVIECAISEAGATQLDPSDWANGRYKPTPTIIEAAQALYGGHKVSEISRSEAGAENLTRTAAAIDAVIEDAKLHHKKVICFITGVPGSGKTLAGLNIANRRMRFEGEEHAVFLSGNGPLVDVLREALTRDALEQARLRGGRASRPEEERKASAFIQNIHHFRDEALQSAEAPTGRIVIFDEAQRAWDVQQASRFMRDRGHADFSQSEPDFLIGVMNRHDDWCAVICLIGGGQEINTGEAGISEWIEALGRSYSHWHVHASPKVASDSPELPLTQSADLHLATSIRSFRAEALSDFVGAVIDGDAAQARHLLTGLSEYPIVLTRDLAAARTWLRSHRRGTQRAGLLASSNALRLKPDGIFVKAKVDPPLWFLNASNDVRSSDALEDAATEFEVQGLELDWSCVAWDANFRRDKASWLPMSFRGTKWQRVTDASRQQYVANAYRVLLTRARQGMVIYVPKGDPLDETRSPQCYDAIAAFLWDCGLSTLG